MRALSPEEFRAANSEAQPSRYGPHPNVTTVTVTGIRHTTPVAISIGNPDPGGGGPSGGGGPTGNRTTPADPSSYSTTPTQAEKAIEEEEIVVTAKRKAIADTHFDQAPANRSEQGFQVWRNSAGQDKIVTGVPVTDGHSPNLDNIQYGGSPGADYHVIYTFHTHPFAGDLPTQDPTTLMTYYGPPSTGDEQVVAGTKGFGSVIDTAGTEYFFGQSPS